MYFLTSPKELKTAALAASKACDIKAAVSALNGILLKLDGTNLTATGYNLELGISIKMQVNGAKNGSAIVDGTALANILGKLEQTKSVEIGIENEIMTIKQGKVKMTLATQSGENFPSRPETSNSFEIEAETLKKIINQTVYAVSVDDIKPTMCGCRFASENGVLKVDATDGMRIAHVEDKCDADMSIVCPSKFLNEVMKNIEKGIVKFGTGGNLISVTTENATIISRMLDGDFINLEKFLNNEAKSLCVIDTTAFAKALDRSQLVAEKSRMPITAKFSTGKVELSCYAGIGNFEEEVECDYTGEAITISFNGKYMLDAISHADSLTATIGLNTSITPMTVKADRYTALVLPVRTK